MLRDTALREEFVRRLAERSPAARTRPPAGNALDVAVQLTSDPRPAAGFVEVHGFEPHRGPS